MEMSFKGRGVLELTVDAYMWSDLLLLIAAQTYVDVHDGSVVYCAVYLKNLCYNIPITSYLTDSCG